MPQHARSIRAGLGLVAASAVGLALLAAPPAPAAAAPDPGVASGDTGDAVLTSQAGLTRAQLDALTSDQPAQPARPAQPQAARRTAAEQNSHPAPAPTAAGAERAARTQAATADRTAATTTAAPQAREGDPTTMAAIGDQPDGARVDECFNAGGADSGVGRIHNRFTYCKNFDFSITYWVVDDKGVPIEEEGTSKGKLQVFSVGDDTDRRIRVWARLKKGSADYDWGPIDNIFKAPNVPLSILGQCQQPFEICQATRGAATMPWATWDNNDDWFYWDVFNREAVSEGRDKISYNRFFVEMFTDGGGYVTPIRARTASRLVRCDSATYFNFGTTVYPKACIFAEVIPHLNYKLDSDYRSVAFHIYEAQFHPNNTYPLLVPPGVPSPRDKRIPGRYVPGDANAPGLHRITDALHPGDTLANEQHKNGACFKTGPFADEYFDTGLPVPPASGEQCDEYPFGSTLEGANHPYWDFSVKAVPQRDNSVAGGLLRAYVVNDRILAWDADLDDPDEANDRYYVNIE